MSIWLCNMKEIIRTLGSLSYNHILITVSPSQWWISFLSGGNNLCMKLENFPQNGVESREKLYCPMSKKWLLLIDDVPPNGALPCRISHFRTWYQHFTVQRNALIQLGNCWARRWKNTLLMETIWQLYFTAFWDLRFGLCIRQTFRNIKKDKEI